MEDHGTASDLLRFHNKYECGPSLAYEDELFCVCVHGDNIKLINLLNLIDPLDPRLGLSRWLLSNGLHIDRLGWKDDLEDNSRDDNVAPMPASSTRLTTRLPLVRRLDSRKAMRRSAQTTQKKRQKSRDDLSLQWTEEALCLIECPRAGARGGEGPMPGKSRAVRPFGTRPIDYLRKSKISDICCHPYNRWYSYAVVSPRLMDEIKGPLWLIIVMTRDGDMALTHYSLTDYVSGHPPSCSEFNGNLTRDLLEFHTKNILGYAISVVRTKVEEEERMSSELHIQPDSLPYRSLSQQSGTYCSAAEHKKARHFAPEEWSVRLREWVGSFMLESLDPHSAVYACACSNTVYLYLLDSSILSLNDHDEFDTRQEAQQSGVDNDAVLPVLWYRLDDAELLGSCLNAVTSIHSELIIRAKDACVSLVVAGYTDGSALLAYVHWQKSNSRSWTPQFLQCQRIDLPIQFPICAIASKQLAVENNVSNGQSCFTVALGQSSGVTAVNYRVDWKLSKKTKEIECSFHYQPFIFQGASTTAVSMTMGSSLRFWHDYLIVMDRGGALAFIGPLDKAQSRFYDWQLIQNFKLDGCNPVLEDYGDEEDTVSKKFLQMNLRYLSGSLLLPAGLMVVNESVGIVSALTGGYVPQIRSTGSILLQWISQVVSTVVSDSSSNSYLESKNLGSWRVACKGAERNPETINTRELLKTHQGDEEEMSNFNEPISATDVPDCISAGLEECLLGVFKLMIRDVAHESEANESRIRDLAILFNSKLTLKQRIQMLFMLRGLIMQTYFKDAKTSLPVWNLKLTRLLLSLWIRIWNETAEVPDTYTDNVSVAPSAQLASRSYDLALYLIGKKEIPDLVDEISFVEAAPYCAHCGSFFFRFMIDFEVDWRLRNEFQEASSNGRLCPFCRSLLLTPGEF